VGAAKAVRKPGGLCARDAIALGHRIGAAETEYAQAQQQHCCSRQRNARPTDAEQLGRRALRRRRGKNRLVHHVVP